MHRLFPPKASPRVVFFGANRCLDEACHAPARTPPAAARGVARRSARRFALRSVFAHGRLPAARGLAHGATITLNGIGRDFNAKERSFAGVSGHDDFENNEYPTTGEKGFVNTLLNASNKLTLSSGEKQSVNSAASFAQWYTTTSSVNREVPISIVLENSAAAPNTYRFSSNSFFPLDGKGMNQQSGPSGNVHNFHFTNELRTTFTYNAGKGDNFSFTGDDDIFVFINRRLAIDLGGVHASQTASVNLDNIATSHSLVSGRVYSLDIFHAERRTTQSNFAISTTLTSIRTDTGGSPPSGVVPEPGTLALAAIGLAAAGWSGRRRAGQRATAGG